MAYMTKKEKVEKEVKTISHATFDYTKNWLIG